MKKDSFLTLILVLSFLEMTMLVCFLWTDVSSPQDTVAVNEVLKRLEADWDSPGSAAAGDRLDYGKR